MRRTTRPETARPGFTLVELMVAMALTILIMAILAGAFQVGLDTMSQLKSVVGMSEQLRTAQTVIIRDLGAPHLEDEWGRPVRVSAPAVQTELQGWTSQTQKRGFFKLRQVAARAQDFSTTPTTAPHPVGLPYADPVNNPNYPFIYEGFDPDGIPSHRATDQVLHFTSRLTGVDADQVYMALAPAMAPPGNLVGTSMNRHDLRVGNQFVSQWAEIAYFLKPSGVTTVGDDAAGGRSLNLFTLYRRQRVLTPGPFTFSFPYVVPTANPTTRTESEFTRFDFPGVSVPPATSPPRPTTRSNDPLAITNPANRLPVDVLLPSIEDGGPEFGTDILLSNVISFQIRVQFEGQPGFVDEWLTGVPGQSARTEPPDGGTDKPRVYDTFDRPDTYPSDVKPRIRAVQLKLRVYDTRNRMTRQVTITQDM